MIEKKVLMDLSILIVEDEKNIRNSIKEILKRFVKNVETAEDGEDGLLKYHQYKPDLILTDIRMPRMSGLTMIKTLKEDNAEFFSVIMSAYDDSKNILEAINNGVNGYIVKPIDYLKLVKIIEEHYETIKLKRDKIRLEKEIRKNKKMKEHIYSIIAHDLRGPLGNNINLIEIMREDYFTISDDEKLEYLAESVKSLRTVFQVLENLLYWTNNSDNNLLQYQNIDITDILNRSLTLLKKAISDKNIKIVISNNSVQSIKADSQMIEAIVRNILSNAIKFSFRDGQIYIRIYEKNEAVIIEIEDNGIGMSNDKIAELAIGTALVSSVGTENEIGIGMGLSICKELAEANGGKIEFISFEGKGTIARLIF